MSNELIFELSIAATILFCLNFWGKMPDLDLHPILGKSISALGILIIFSMIAFRFKWPIVIGLAGMAVYLGISFFQGEPEKKAANPSSNARTPVTVSVQPQESHSLNISHYYTQEDTVKVEKATP